MENKNEYQAQLFANRLSKKFKTLRKWARRERVTCYRLYDRDIPEVPLACDLYEFIPHEVENKIENAQFMLEEERLISANDINTAKEKTSRSWLHIYLYERPYEKDLAEEEAWLEAMKMAAAQVTGISPDHIITKMRKKQRGENQYEKLDVSSERKIEGTAQECGQLFKINLSEYLDTGLFFDHRPLRSIVRKECSGKSVLNLFCYTGSFSVYAAEGKANRVESVDLSNTYIAWAKDNFKLNGFNDDKKYVFTRGDVTGFLNQKLAEVANQEGTNRYDIIILDPPTFSNSKATQNTLDINRDWSELVTKCLNLLKSGGTLYFSTNSKRLSFDRNLLPQATSTGAVISCTDMTEESLPEDYKTTKSRRCWKFKIGKY